MLLHEINALVTYHMKTLYQVSLIIFRSRLIWWFHFKWLTTDIMYFIFKIYCMTLYGSQLCYLDYTAINRCYVTWHKDVRYFLHLPRTTNIKVYYDITERDNAHIAKTYKEHHISASVIRDLLTMKYDNMYHKTKDSITISIYIICSIFYVSCKKVM